MKPNFRWKTTVFSADNRETSNEDNAENTLPFGVNEVAANNVTNIGSDGTSHHAAGPMIKDPDAEGRKPKCFCSLQVRQSRTQEEKRWCMLKNLFNWRPDWRGSFVFIVIVVCFLSRTTLGAVNSDSNTADGDHVLFSARRLSGFPEADLTNFQHEENSETGGEAGANADSEQVPCGSNNGLHVKIQYSTSIVENGNISYICSDQYLLTVILYILHTYRDFMYIYFFGKSVSL